MSGDPPFEYKDFKQLKAKILTGVSAESLPDACKKSEPCRNLVHQGNYGPFSIAMLVITRG